MLTSRARLSEAGGRSEAISTAFTGAICRLHLTKSSAKGRRMPVMTPAPRRRPLWRLFFMPVLLLVAAVGVERVLVLCRLRKSACAPTPGARRRRKPAGSMIAPTARLPASRSASKSRCEDASVALVSQTAARAGAVHRAARRNPGGGADLRSENDDRGIQGAGDDRRSRRASRR